MKSYKLKLARIILFVFPGVALGTPATYTSGDILMGFRADSEPGSNTSYVINLGPVAALRDATAPINLPLGNLKADLDFTFGSGWRTRTDLFWGVGGTPSNVADVASDPTVTLYGSKVQTSVGTPGTAWSVAGSSTRTSIATVMKGLQDAFPTYQQTANSTKAVLQTNSTDSFDWRAYMATGGDPDKTTGNKDFGAFANIEGLPAQTLSLFRLPNQAQGVYEGYFSISAAGVVTFTPEPSTLTFATWSLTNSPGQTASQDYDNDGLSNGIEFFMGTPGNAPTPSPALVNGTITWPRATGRSISSFGVVISSDLGISDPWHAPTPGPTITTTQVSYSLPNGQGRIFSRLFVTP